MSQLPNCPQCGSEYTYQDGNLLICPMCNYEWTEEEAKAKAEAAIVRDANGNPLENGDSASVVAEIKLSGANRIKQGTKVTKISILDEPYNDHNIEANVDGHGRMYLKSELIKK